MADQTSRESIPVGVEKLLLAASEDPALCEALLADRLGVAARLNIPLGPAEQAILTSAPEATLRSMIHSIQKPDHRRRRFLQAVAATSAAAMLSCDGTGDTPDTGVPLMDGGGARPDVDPLPDADLDAEADATVDASLLDDAGMSWGSRPETDGG